MYTNEMILRRHKRRVNSSYVYFGIRIVGLNKLLKVVAIN